MKCSINAIEAGDEAYAAEVHRLQVAQEGEHQEGADPFLHVVPDVAKAPSEVEMLLAGLREIEREGE